MKAHVLVLTTKSVDLTVLPPHKELTIHRLQTHPDFMNQDMIRVRTGVLMDELLKERDFGIMSPVYIIMEATANSIIALNIIQYAMWQVAMFPQIWLVQGEEKGMYIGHMFNWGEAQEWVTKFNAYMRERIAFSNLEK